VPTVRPSCPAKRDALMDCVDHCFAKLTGCPYSLHIWLNPVKRIDCRRNINHPPQVLPPQVRGRRSKARFRVSVSEVKQDCGAFGHDFAVAKYQRGHLTQWIVKSYAGTRRLLHPSRAFDQRVGNAQQRECSFDSDGARPFSAVQRNSHRNPFGSRAAHCCI
jgi:hypothetical protein